MSDEKQEKYLSKQVKLGGHSVTLYSINGLTWVSDPSGLTELMDRLENARVSFNDPKGAAGDKDKNKQKEKFKPRGPRGAAPTQQDEGELEDDGYEDTDLENESDDEVKEPDHSDEEVVAKSKKLAKPALPSKSVAPVQEKKAQLKVIPGKGNKAAKPAVAVKAPAKAKKPAAAKPAKAAAPKKSAPKALGPKACCFSIPACSPSVTLYFKGIHSPSCL